jgi:hypothetical protein
MIQFSKFKAITSLLTETSFIDSGVIPWASPILYFGDLEKSKIATLGINPSNKEFFDNNSSLLKEENSRFHTLDTLRISKWDELNDVDFEKILFSYKNYFRRNPYDIWFKKLDYIISGNSISYYFPSQEACHLDIFPFATFEKWSNISSNNKAKLLEIALFILAEILNSSDIKILILNGMSVVRHLEKAANTKFVEKEISEWELKRSNNAVKGFSYTGILNQIGGIKLKKEIKVLGFNHNLQSSYGVTTSVMNSIRKWLTSEI